MSDDASFSIEERQAIRRAAEATLKALDVPQGAATLLDGESALGLVALFSKAGIPMSAECYDLAVFDLMKVVYTKPNLLRLSDTEGDHRVFEIGSGLVLYFPETLGQAPVLYLEARERSQLPHLLLQEEQLEEWPRPVRFHLSLLGDEQLIYLKDEVISYLRQEMTASVPPLPELRAFITSGIALGIHVAPRQFCYRFPEYNISRIAHWQLAELQEDLQNTMNAMISLKSI